MFFRRIEVNSFDLFLFFQKTKRIDSIYPVFSKKMKQNVSFEKFPKKISKKNFDRRGRGVGMVRLMEIFPTNRDPLNL
jgi:hypothetical protein